MLFSVETELDDEGFEFRVGAMNAGKDVTDRSELTESASVHFGIPFTLDPVEWREWFFHFHREEGSTSIGLLGFGVQFGQIEIFHSL